MKADFGASPTPPWLGRCKTSPLITLIELISAHPSRTVWHSRPGCADLLCAFTEAVVFMSSSAAPFL